MTAHTKYSFCTFLLGLSLFLACKSVETTPSDRVSVGLNKSARVGVDLTVRVDSLSDSRCPSGAQCIWAGEAVVAVSLSKGAETQKRRLKLPAYTTSRTDSTTVQFGSLSYSVILRDVTPYPALGNYQSEKQAVIQVTKR